MISREGVARQSERELDRRAALGHNRRITQSKLTRKEVIDANTVPDFNDQYSVRFSGLCVWPRRMAITVSSKGGTSTIIVFS